MLSGFVRAIGPLAVVDLETTGLSQDPAAEMLEFGAVLLDPEADELTTLERLICPKGILPRAVQQLTGLTLSDVAAAPEIEALAKPIATALAGRTIIAHNADFERHFLSRFVAAELAKSPYLDTQDLLALSHPDASDLRLETFTRDMFAAEERHRALSDALDTLRVLSRAARGARQGERRYVTARNAVDRFAPDSPWRLLLDGGGLVAESDPLPQFVSIPESIEKPVPFDADSIATVLSDEERGRRYFPGYRVREEQIHMAREFVQVLSEGGRLLLEGEPASESRWPICPRRFLMRWSVRPAASVSRSWSRRERSSSRTSCSARIFRPPLQCSAIGICVRCRSKAVQTTSASAASTWCRPRVVSPGSSKRTDWPTRS